MAKKNKQPKSTLTQAEKEMGKNNVFIIIGMIVVGLAVAVYAMF